MFTPESRELVKPSQNILTNYYELLTFVIRNQLGASAEDVLHVLTSNEPLTLYEIAIKVKEMNKNMSSDALKHKVNAVETNFESIKQNKNNNDNNDSGNTNSNAHETKSHISSRKQSIHEHNNFTELLTDVAIKEIMTRLLLHRCVRYNASERTYVIDRFASLLLRICYPLMYNLVYREFGVLGHTMIVNVHELAMIPFDVLMQFVRKQTATTLNVVEKSHKATQYNSALAVNNNNINNSNNTVEEINKMGKLLLERGWIELLDSHSSHINTNLLPSAPCRLNLSAIKLMLLEDALVDLISDYYEQEDTTYGLHCAIIRVFFDALRKEEQENEQQQQQEEEKIFVKEEQEHDNRSTLEHQHRNTHIIANDRTAVHSNIINNNNKSSKDTSLQFPALSTVYIKQALQGKLNTSISEEAIYNTLMQLYNTEHNCLQTFHGLLEVNKSSNQVMLSSDVTRTHYNLREHHNSINDEEEGHISDVTATNNTTTTSVTTVGNSNHKRGRNKETSNSKKSKEHKKVTFENAQRALWNKEREQRNLTNELSEQRRLINIIKKPNSEHNDFYNMNEFTEEYNYCKSNIIQNNNNTYHSAENDISFTLNTSTLIDCLQAQVIERVIFSRYGVLGVRITKLLFAKYKWLEDKHIAEETIATLAHVREVLHGMLHDGYCLQQEVPRSSNVNERMVKNSVFLWGNESVIRLVPIVREHLAKSLHNALTKLNELTATHNNSNSNNDNNVNMHHVIPTNITANNEQMNTLLKETSFHTYHETKVNHEVIEQVIHKQRQVVALQSCALSLIRMLLIMNFECEDEEWEMLEKK